MQFCNPRWPVYNVKAFTTTKLSPENLIPSFPQQVCWLQQHHGNNVIRLEDEYSSIQQADAAVSSERDMVCVVRTADCLPILITAQDGTEVAAVHAGWRGLAARIINQTIAKMRSKPQDLFVWLGPAISAQHFEVDDEVLATFIDYGWSPRHVEEGFLPRSDCWRDNKWLGDLYHLAILNLQQLGVPADHISGGNFCTYGQEQYFYSHRRGKDEGRMCSMIWIEHVP